MTLLPESRTARHSQLRNAAHIIAKYLSTILSVLATHLRPVALSVLVTKMPHANKLTQLITSSYSSSQCH